jgi:hypothetical protein
VLDAALHPTGNGKVFAADLHRAGSQFLLQLRSGTDAPEGWSALAGTTLHYKLTPRG